MDRDLPYPVVRLATPGTASIHILECGKDRLYDVVLAVLGVKRLPVVHVQVGHLASWLTSIGVVHNVGSGLDA